MTRDFITIGELSSSDLNEIYLGARTTPIGNELAQTSVALVFEYPSLRTRASSVAAVQALGARLAMFTGDEVGLDSRESAEDVARTLAATSNVAAFRVRDHGVFARMRTATAGQLRLINLLSNYAHPTQAVADVLTLADHFAGGDVAGLNGCTVAYVGDATNVTRSLATALVRLGVRVRVGAPNGYQLTKDDLNIINAMGTTGSLLSLHDDAREAVEGANAVYTDSWVSMGLEDEAARRLVALKPFQVNTELMKYAAADALVMHCLPAHRGEEITDEVLDSPASVVWEQVRHRTSSMIGVLRWMNGAPS